jgi:hypothetical protein
MFQVISTVQEKGFVLQYLCQFKVPYFRSLSDESQNHLSSLVESLLPAGSEQVFCQEGTVLLEWEEIGADHSTIRKETSRIATAARGFLEDLGFQCDAIRGTDLDSVKEVSPWDDTLVDTSDSEELENYLIAEEKQRRESFNSLASALGMTHAEAPGDIKGRAEAADRVCALLGKPMKFFSYPDTVILQFGEDQSLSSNPKISEIRMEGEDERRARGYSYREVTDYYNLAIGLVPVPLEVVYRELATASEGALRLWKKYSYRPGIHVVANLALKLEQ